MNETLPLFHITLADPLNTVLMVSGGTNGVTMSQLASDGTALNLAIRFS